MSKEQSTPRSEGRWARWLFRERVGAALFVMVSLGALIALTVPLLAARGHPTGAKLLVGAFVALLLVYLIGYLVFNFFKG